jgi:hypothetical protein
MKLLLLLSIFFSNQIFSLPPIKIECEMKRVDKNQIKTFFMFDKVSAVILFDQLDASLSATSMGYPGYTWAIHVLDKQKLSYLQASATPYLDLPNYNVSITDPNYKIQVKCQKKLK